MSSRGWGSERVFFGGTTIERSHELFTVKNDVFYQKLDFLDAAPGNQRQDARPRLSPRGEKTGSYGG